MHTYSINSNERITILGWLGFISVAIIWSIHKYIPDGFPVPSVFALFSGIVFVFDKWLWCWSIFQKTIIKTPNLNGKWTMLSKSSLKDPNEEYEAILTIKQTWTKIHLFMDGEKTTSVSVMSGIEIMTDDLFFLKWEYRAEYKPTFIALGNIHYGITKMMMKPISSPDRMEGNYYTDQSRDSQGPVSLIKKA